MEMGSQRDEEDGRRWTEGGKRRQRRCRTEAKGKAKYGGGGGPKAKWFVGGPSSVLRALGDSGGAAVGSPEKRVGGGVW